VLCYRSPFHHGVLPLLEVMGFRVSQIATTTTPPRRHVATGQVAGRTQRQVT
jgi:hypothetical protein